MRRKQIFAKEYPLTHDSDDHYKRMQQQIQQDEFLRSYLHSFNQQQQNPFTQRPPWNPPQFQTFNTKPLSTQYIYQPEPNSLKPHSLNHSIGRNRYLHQREQLRRMDAINWSTGTRPNRPFENHSSTQPIYHNDNIHAFPPRRPQLYEPVRPTEYFKEQLFLARDGTGPNPYTHHPPTEIARGLIDLWVVLLATSVIKPLLDAGQTTVSFIGNTIFFAVFWGAVKPVRYLSDLANKAEWDVMLAFVLAAQVVRWLPALEGTVLRNVAEEVTEPVYVVNLPAGYAFGTGPVLGNL